MNEYRIVNVLSISGKSLATLDRKREDKDLIKNVAVISGKKYSFLPTHSELSIVVDTSDDINGQKIYFE